MDSIGDNHKSTTNSNNTAEHVQQLLHLWRYYTNILPASGENSDSTIKSIATDICCLLSKTNSIEALSVFLDEIPNTEFYWKDESILRARIEVALFKKDAATVKKILTENAFSNNENLLEFWDQAHYICEETRQKKQLSPLTRFRVRKRNPPPRTICAGGVRKTSSLPKEATALLKTWYLNHKSDPYPTVMEKQQLARVSGLTIPQVKTWFANARRRSKTHDDGNSEQRRVHHHSLMGLGGCIENYKTSAFYTAATTAKKPGSLPSPTSSTSSMTTALMMEDQMSRHHGLGGIEGGGGSPTAAFQFCYQDHLSPFSSSTALQSHHFHHHHNSSSGGHYHNGSLAAMLPVETINSGGAVLHQYSSSNEVHPVQSTRMEDTNNNIQFFIPPPYHQVYAQPNTVGYGGVAHCT